MKSDYNKELAAGIALLLSGTVFLLISIFTWCYMIPFTIKRTGGNGSIAENPTIFPKVFVICVAITSAVLIIHGLKECMKNRQYICVDHVKIELSRLLLLDSPSLIVFSVLSVLFCMIVPVLGFFTTSLIVMSAAALYLGNRSFWWIVAYPVVFTLVLWFVFAILLSVRFPAGILI